MDRIVPRPRQLVAPALLLLALGATPQLPARAALPDIYEAPAGDPGDGVLRPAGHEAQAALTPTDRGSATVTTLGPQSTAAKPVPASVTTLRLVPVLPPPGQPWLLSFRLVRCVDGDQGAGDPRAPGLPWRGRWHRAF